MMPTRIIATRYLGPTDHHGARIVARNVNSGKRAEFNWDHALDPRDCHAKTAQALSDLIDADRPDETTHRIVSYSSAETIGQGYVFVFEPFRPDPSAD